MPPMETLGATRKHRSAPKIAAIALLAEGIRQLTGKANRPAVVELAQVILKTNVTIETVDHVIRSREQQRWPLFFADGGRHSAEK